jgi:hypothetical protein
MNPILDVKNIKMYEADVFMKDSLEKYLNGNKEDGYTAEVHALSIIVYLSNEGLKDAKDVLPFLLKPSQVENIKTLKGLKTSADSLLNIAKKESNDFNYEAYKTQYGGVAADKQKATLQTNLTNAEESKKTKTINYDTEFKKITTNYSERAGNYEDVRGAAYAATTTDPVVQLNRVVFDVNRAYPEYAYSSDNMNEQLKGLFDNYNTDVSYMRSIHSLMTDISQNLMGKVEHDLEVKRREQEIQEYYNKQYKQQIFLLKLVIVFSIIALIGCLVYHYGFMSTTKLMVYLGTVSGIAFIVLFYYLWDFYIRDTKVFDEYDFSAYLPPSTEGRTLENSGAFKDNIIYC